MTEKTRILALSAGASDISDEFYLLLGKYTALTKRHPEIILDDEDQEIFNRVRVGATTIQQLAENYVKDQGLDKGDDPGHTFPLKVPPNRR